MLQIEIIRECDRSFWYFSVRREDSTEMSFLCYRGSVPKVVGM